MWVLNSVKDRDSSAPGVNLHHHLTPSYSRSVFFVIVSMAYLVFLCIHYVSLQYWTALRRLFIIFILLGIYRHEWDPPWALSSPGCSVQQCQPPLMCQMLWSLHLCVLLFGSLQHMLMCVSQWEAQNWTQHSDVSHQGIVLLAMLFLMQPRMVSVFNATKVHHWLCSASWPPAPPGLFSAELLSTQLVSSL